MPVNYVLFQWAEHSARAHGHRLNKWEQQGNIAVAECTRCGRVATVDFSRSAAARDEEIGGSAVIENCDYVER